MIVILLIVLTMCKVPINSVVRWRYARVLENSQSVEGQVWRGLMRCEQAFTYLGHGTRCAYGYG
jgi:hypothetical protein